MTDALTRHEQNMRLNIVLDIYARINLKELRGWLSKHPEIKSLYEEKDSVYQQLESEVTNFVKTRNSASHGGMDHLEGEQDLYRYCNVVRALIKALTCYLSKDILMRKMELGTAIKLGTATEVFPKSSAFVAKLCKGAEMAIGDEIFLLDSSNCYIQIVESIMLNDQQEESVIATQNEYEIGIKSSGKVKVKSQIIKCL